MAKSVHPSIKEMQFSHLRECTVAVERTSLLHYVTVLLLCFLPYCGTSLDLRVLETETGSVMVQLPDGAKVRHQHHKFSALEEELKSEFLVKNLRSLLDESGRVFPGEKSSWPVKREAVVEGDLILGGIYFICLFYLLINW